MVNDSPTISTRVLDAIVQAQLVTTEQLDAVREGSFSESDVGRQLMERGLVTEAQLGELLEDELGLPRVDLESYQPDEDALALVPASLARSYGVLPLFEIESTLTIAVGDPADVFLLDAMSEQLGLSLDAVLADPSAVRSSIVQYLGEESAGEPEEPEPVEAADLEEDPAHGATVADDEFDEGALGETCGHESVAQTVEEVVASEAVEGSDAIDLEVLAVADDSRVALLVAEILEYAIASQATRIQLLPYKNDFFLVFRIRGRLEKIASASLSLQQPLIDGFKSFARVGEIPSTEPAVARIRTEIAGTPVVLGMSSVPTVAGQRMVITLSPADREPRGLGELGMSDAEYNALFAMVERGRGLMLVCAPIAGGASTTYYALLQHAAGIGKTVYSVERSIEHEMPSVAQVLLNPGVSAAAFLSAGMRQDTDVLAIDSLHTVEDVHLAIQAATLGKLVIATYTAGDVVSGVRRLLDLGAEPVSLAAALTLGVGQRVVRVNCDGCSSGHTSPLLSLLPGADTGTAKRGSGCPSCNATGFGGTTGVFEILPFTEPVRAVISRGGSAQSIAEAAAAAGMRSLVHSGAVKVREGIVSPEELDRVLRYSRR